MDNKQKYIAFTETNYVPIFYRPYYLDAVCDAPWDVVLLEKGGKIIASWVYMLKNKLGLTYIVHAQLCPFMGPIFFEDGNYPLMYKNLLDQLPKHHLLIQDFSVDCPSIDFSTSHTPIYSKQTYIIEANTNLDGLKRSKSLRRKIRKASENLIVEETEDFDTFFNLLEYSFRQKGIPNPYNRTIYRKLDASLAHHNNRKILLAKNEESKLLAAEYLMIDEKWIYNFSNANDKIYNHNGVSLLIWEGIKQAIAQGKSFDFEGSMIPGVEAFYQAFGGTKTAYQIVYHSQNKLIDLFVKAKNQFSGK